jgi:drug/metabolite transporter (DMT)-like permease
VTALLFALASLLWGGGALAAAMQAGVTPAPWSVALRMALAGLLLLGFAGWRRVPLRIPRRDLAFVGLQGVLFFAVAFIAFYESTRRIPSGLAALVLSTSSLFAALIGRVLLGRVLLGTPVSSSLLWGALCGIIGVGIIFGPGLAGVAAGAGAGLASGLCWGPVSAVATAGGTVIGARNQRAGLPTLAVLGWGAWIGCATSAAWAMAQGAPFIVDPSPRYLASLVYLAVAASCIAFLLYFELVQRLGPGKAAYIFATVPVVALLLSALFEGLRLDLRMTLGVLVILAGNVLVLRK